MMRDLWQTCFLPVTNQKFEWCHLWPANLLRPNDTKWMQSYEQALLRFTESHPLEESYIRNVSKNWHTSKYLWSTINWGFPGVARGKEPTCQCRKHKDTWVASLGWEDPLEEGVAMHSSILAWRIPCTEEPRGLQSTGAPWIRHDWSDLACTINHFIKMIP